MCESKTIDIDMENLIAQVDRTVTLGELDEYAEARGLMFAPYTPDKKDLTIGEMYSEQVGSLTGQKYGLPKFHVMGLEVVLANGEILKIGGKTVKNVTGYDLTRLFISSRETIGVPATFTLKLMPQEEVQVFYVLNISGTAELQMLLDKMNQEKILPAVSCFWDVPMMQPIRMLLGLAGIKEKVEADLKILTEIVRTIDIEIFIIKGIALDKVWETISGLRENSIWHDCFKIMPDRLGCLVEAFHGIKNVPLGLWGNPLQGKINMMMPKDTADEKLYQRLAQMVKGLNGATNWYYDRRYNMENPLLKVIADRLQNTFEGRGNRDEQESERDLGK